MSQVMTNGSANGVSADTASNRSSAYNALMDVEQSLRQLHRGIRALNTLHDIDVIDRPTYDGALSKLSGVVFGQVSGVVRDTLIGRQRAQ